MDAAASPGFLGKVPVESLQRIYEFLGPRSTLSLGAGVAINEELLRRMGASIIATDAVPHDGVEEVDALTAVQRYHSRCKQLFFCWPPPFSSFPHAALLRYEELTGALPQRVVYIGEGMGGMTADDTFHTFLNDRYRLVGVLETIRFEGVEDAVYLYEAMAVSARPPSTDHDGKGEGSRCHDAGTVVAAEDAIDDVGEALRLACLRGDVGHVRELVGSCATVDTTRCLFAAAWNGPLASVRLLLEAAAKVNHRQQRGRSALHLAAQAGHGDICTALLDAHAAVDDPCSLGLTPLGYALQFGQPDAAEAICARGGSSTYLCAGGSQPQSSCRLDCGRISTERSAVVCTDGAGTRARAELPPEFATMASRMARPLQRLIVENANPRSVSAAAVIHALMLPLDQYMSACDVLAAPASEALLHIRQFLDAAACASLRAEVDSHADASPDSVDNLLDHQFNVPSVARLGELIGSAAVQRLLSLPAKHRCSTPLERANAHQHTDADTPRLSEGSAVPAEASGPLRIQSIFIRRYTGCGRPWLQFHQDRSPLTVNVALSTDGEHEQGGRLLGLFDGAVHAIHRGEGDAVVHRSTLLHGVSCICGDRIRYSLIVFFEREDE